MGRAPAAARLFPLHTLRPAVPAGTRWLPRHPSGTGRRVLPSPLTEVAERAAILPGTAGPARRDLLRAACAAAAAARSARQEKKLYTGVYMFRAQVGLFLMAAALLTAAD